MASVALDEVHIQPSLYSFTLQKQCLNSFRRCREKHYTLWPPPVYLSLNCVWETSCPHVYHLQNWHDCRVFICQRPHGRATRWRFTGTKQGAWSCMCLICTREKCTRSAVVRCHARCTPALRGRAPMRASS